MKNPAVLFYTSDFLTGTTFMSNEEVGAYIRLLCYQHQKGHIKKKDMNNICNTLDKDSEVYDKFLIDNNGCYYNQRMDEEIAKRSKYSQSRSNNRLKAKEHMNNICKSYDNHMENENEDDNIITYYSNNIRSITPIEYERLTKWEETFSDDMIKYAIELAVKANARSFDYIEAIFKNWQSKGYKTIIDIEKLDKKKKQSDPSWLDQTITREELSEEEKIEMEDLMEEIKK